MIAFQTERLADVREEAWPLLLRNAEETGVERFKIEHDPDWAKYEMLESMGLFCAFTVRRFGILIGYAAFLMSNSMHARGLRIAVCDLIWVAPEHRRSTTGVRLIRFCEDAMRAAGCALIVIGVKPFNSVDLLLERMGYGEAERQYMKRLDVAHG